MGDILAAEPKEGSYLTEWKATQFETVEDVQSIRRLLRNTGYAVYLDIDAEEVTEMRIIVAGHGQTLRCGRGDWVVLSPHARLTILDPGTFWTEMVVMK